jgi:hypothetical protein
MRVGYRIDLVVSLNLWEVTDTDHRRAISTAPQEFEQRLIHRRDPVTPEKKGGGCLAWTLLHQ